MDLVSIVGSSYILRYEGFEFLLISICEGNETDRRKSLYNYYLELPETETSLKIWVQKFRVAKWVFSALHHLD